jgi:hypothetical protein
MRCLVRQGESIDTCNADRVRNPLGPFLALFLEAGLLLYFAHRGKADREVAALPSAEGHTQLARRLEKEPSP